MPSPSRLTSAVVLAAALSVVACAVLAAGGRALWPFLDHDPHLRIGDYGPLAVAGVVGAGLAWPVVVARCATPRRAYLRLAVVVSVLLLAPDGYLLATGQPGRGVAVLVAMHLAVAAVTYPLVVGVARPDPGRPVPAGGRPSLGAGAPWVAMAALVGLVAVLGLLALAVVPTGRPEGLVPATGQVAYLLHATSGGLLGLAAVAAVLVTRRHGRLARRSALVGLAATVVAGAGGALDVLPPERLLAVILMLAGAVVAGFAYLAPVSLAAGPVAPMVGPDGVVSCRRCRSSAPAGRWSPEVLAAGRCPLCTGRTLKGGGLVATCPCCRTAFRQVVGDEAAWIVTPGGRVASAL